MRDVHHLGNGHLHPVRQLVLRDARARFRVAELGGLEFVQGLQRIEAFATQRAVEARGIGGVEHRVALRTALHALEDGGEESAAVGILAAVRLHAAGDQHHETGQVLVLRAEAIGDP